MNISKWLDEKEAESLDVSQIALPKDLSYDGVPDETKIEISPSKRRNHTWTKESGWTVHLQGFPQYIEVPQNIEARRIISCLSAFLSC